MKKAQKLVSDGNKIFNKRDYEGAIKKYSEAITLVDNYPAAHFWKGNAHYYLKQNELALEELNKASEQGYTPITDVYKVRWYLNYVQKNYDAALDDLNKSVQADPNSLQLRAGLGDVYYAKGMYQDALNIYNDIVGKIPNNGNTYYSMADSYFNLGDLTKAKEMAELAMQNGTQYMADSYILIGRYYQKERKYVEAADNFEKSLKLEKNNYRLYRNLSDVYRNQNRFNEAIQITKKALEIFPRDGNLYTDISWYYSLADKYGDSVGQAQIAISLLPDSFQAYTYLCRGYNDLKEYQKAIIECNKALKLNPDDGETNFYIGRAYELSGKKDTAKPFYKKAVDGLVKYTERYPDFADGYYLLGNAYYSNDNLDKAIESYKRSLELSPKFKKARYNLGYVYVQKKEFPSAEEQYVALLEIDKVLAEKLKETMPKK